MPAERAEVERVLERVLGFKRSESDHHRFTLSIEGKVIASTFTSHSPKARTLDDGILSDMARQMNIRLSFLKAILAGKKTRNDYLNELNKNAAR